MHKLYTIIWYDVDCINKIPLGTLHTVFNFLHFTISFSDKEIVPAVYTYTIWKMYNAAANDIYIYISKHTLETIIIYNTLYEKDSKKWFFKTVLVHIFFLYFVSEVV